MVNSADKLLYSVVIFRKGLDPISTPEIEDYDSCLALWKEFHIRWRDCIKESSPFVLEDPIVTAFDPGLIFEISLIPIKQEISKNQMHNPYVKKMREEGFTNAFRGNTNPVGRDLLDSGFTPY